MQFIKKLITLFVCLCPAQSSFTMNKAKFKFNKIVNNISKKELFKTINKKFLFNKIPKTSFGATYFKTMNWKKYALMGGLASYGFLKWNINRALADVSQEQPEKEKVKMLEKRPEAVQRAVDVAFEEVSTRRDRDWSRNGRSYYYILDLDDKKLLESLVISNERDIYIIDVGCGNGKWGKNALEILQSDACKQSGKRFHIFSITGGRECNELIEQKEHVTLYQLNQFKIENIQDEFLKRGFDLKDKVSLIVSSWTLRHVVDGWGTLKQLHGLLVPQEGRLLSTGFFFNDKRGSDREPISFPRSSAALFAQSFSTILFQEYGGGQGLGSFILVRNDRSELDIPLVYEGTNSIDSDGYDSAAGEIVVYNWNGPKIPKEKLGKEYVDENRKFYCNKGNQSCKDLYRSLKVQGFFD